MAIDTLIFNLGGVLVLTMWERVTGPWAALSGLTGDEVWERILAGDAYRPFMTGEIDRAEFHRRMCSSLGVDEPADAMFETWSSAIVVNAAIAPLIARLARRYRLIVGSNTDELHYARGQEVQPALAQFDDAILSYRQGVLKPSATFFERGLQELGATLDQCFFTDDRQDNVEAARRTGIEAVRFESVPGLEAHLKSTGLL